MTKLLIVDDERHGIREELNTSESSVEAAMASNLLPPPGMDGRQSR